MTSSEYRYLQKYVQYIRNTGQVPLKLADFDDDWAPIGPDVRARMVKAGLITEGENGLKLVPRKRIDENKGGRGYRE